MQKLQFNVYIRRRDHISTAEYAHLLDCRRQWFPKAASLYHLEEYEVQQSTTQN